MSNSDIDIIKEKFLSFMASAIESYTRKKVETEGKKECLIYTESLLNLINKSKDFFAISIEESKEEKEKFITIMSTVLSKDEIDEILNNIKNIYYLKKSIDLNQEETKPQQIESYKELNKFINFLNKYIYRENLNTLSKTSKEIDTFLNRINDIATQIEYNTEITDIDLLEKLIELSALTDSEKEEIIINSFNANLYSYKIPKEDELLPLTETDEKLSALEDLLEEDSTKREIISIMEDIPLSKVNLENYKVEGNYSNEIEIYLSCVRDEVTEYLKKHKNSTPEFAYKRYINKRKREKLKESKEKTSLVSIVYLKDEELPYIENDLDNLDNASKKKVKEALEKLRSNSLHPKKENTELTKSITYGVNTATNNGINISYIPVGTSYYNIVLGVSDKKLKDHERLIEERVEKEEDQIVLLMIDIMREENIDEIKEKSNSDEKRVLNALSSKKQIRKKEPEIEILDEKKVI